MVDLHAKSGPSYLFQNLAVAIGLRFGTKASAPFSLSKPVDI
jgi:hypothetical protein